MLGGRRIAQQVFLLAVNPAARATRELKLSRPESSVGSDESNDLVIRDGTVSRRHALLRLRRRRGRWQVVDNGSTNGTYVGEKKAVAWITLHDGEEILSRAEPRSYEQAQKRAGGLRSCAERQVERD